jgi:hypothetical protein
MNILKMFKKKRKLNSEEEEMIKFAESDSYFKEALKLVKERGIKRAREDYQI